MRTSTSHIRWQHFTQKDPALTKSHQGSFFFFFLSSCFEYRDYQHQNYLRLCLSAMISKKGKQNPQSKRQALYPTPISTALLDSLLYVSDLPRPRVLICHSFPCLFLVLSKNFVSHLLFAYKLLKRIS